MNINVKANININPTGKRQVNMNPTGKVQGQHKPYT